MRIYTGLAVAALTLAPLATGQKLDLKTEDLAAKASEKNEVDLDGALLKMAIANLPQLAAKKARNANPAAESKEPAKPPQLPAILSTLTGVYVRNYHFPKPGEYSDADLDRIRTQVAEGSGWARIIRTNERGKSTEIYLLNHGDEIAGCLILAGEPKELTIVHVTGAATMAQIREIVNSDIKYDLAGLMNHAGAKQ